MFATVKKSHLKFVRVRVVSDNRIIEFFFINFEKIETIEKNISWTGEDFKNENYVIIKLPRCIFNLSSIPRYFNFHRFENISNFRS